MKGQCAHARATDPIFPVLEVHEDPIGGRWAFLPPLSVLRTTQLDSRPETLTMRRYAYASLSQWPEDHRAGG